MAKKIQLRRFPDKEVCSETDSKKQNRIASGALHQKKYKKTSLRCSTGIISSAIAFTLTVTGPAWGVKGIVPHDNISLPRHSVPYLTSVLPPLTPPETWRKILSSADSHHREILFIDQGITQYQNLIQSLSRNVEIVYLAPDQDGMAAIASHLDGLEGIRGIHIVSHGGPGRLILGNTVFTADMLAERRQDLVKWSEALGPEGDILLYGCDVAKGLEGIRFVNRLADTLMAGISASNDPTGIPSLGGDWTLEYRRDVEIEPVFSSSVVKNFHSLLAAGQVIAGDGSGGGGGGGGTGGMYYTGGPGGQGGSGAGDADTIIGTDANDIIFGDGSGGGGGGGGDTTKYGYGYGTPGTNGLGGTGGSGNDSLHGGDGDDIIFGDGFDGFSSMALYSGDYGGYGNINSGRGGDNNQAGQPGFGGALGGSAGAYVDKYSSGTPGQAGENGSTATVTLDDTGGAIHADTTAKLASGYFTSKTGGNGNDTLDGGPGSDALLGMGGTNTFAFESNDATSGSDVDTIYDWNSGEGNKIELKTNGKTLSESRINNILSAQLPAGDDRTIVHVHGSNQVTIMVKDIGRDLTLDDFVVGDFPWTMFLPAITGQK